MDIQGWLKQWLGIKDIEAKLIDLDWRMSAVEDQVFSTLKHFGKYKHRTSEELLLMRSQIQTMLESVENVLDSIENHQGQIRALRLRARLRNNLNRINNTVNSAIG